MEIKLDRSTLPDDGQKIKWQTQQDIDKGNWKEGVFAEGDDLFLIGFDDSSNNWNISWDVENWEALK